MNFIQLNLKMNKSTYHIILFYMFCIYIIFVLKNKMRFYSVAK